MKNLNGVKKVSIMTLAFIILVMSSKCLVANAGISINYVSENQPTYGIVQLNSGTLNVRISASTSAAIVASVPNNTRIMIVGQSGNFYKVQYNTSGNYGYVSKDYVVYMGSNTVYYLQAHTAGSNLNMRAGESTSTSLVASIPNGKAFPYLSDNSNGWYKGLYGYKEGFVSSTYAIKWEYSSIIVR